MRFGLSSVLREGEGDGDGNKGGVAGLTMDDVNKAVNGAVAKLKTEMNTSFQGMLKPFEGLGAQLTQITENLTALQTASTAAGEGGKKKVEGAALDPEVAATLKRLEKTIETQGTQLKSESDARKSAEAKSAQTAKESALRVALKDFNFATPDAAEDAFTLLLNQVEDGDEDGQYVAGGLPLKDFVTDFLPTKKAHLLAPVNKGGAGANTGTKQGASKGFDMDSIKVGMSADETKAAGAEILRVLKG